MLRSAADDNLAMKISVAILAAVSLLGLVGASSASSPVSAPLIAYWNGTSWTQQEAQNPDSSASLTAITAVSATDVWALGAVLHWAASGCVHVWVIVSGLNWKTITFGIGISIVGMNSTSAPRR